jgi:hypothetical protein
LWRPHHAVFQAFGDIVLPTFRFVVHFIPGKEEMMALNIQSPPLT